MTEQTFKTAAEVEELFKTHPDNEFPIFRIRHDRGLYIMDTELIPLFGLLKKWFDGHYAEDGSHKNRRSCGDIEVYGLFTPRQMLYDLPCDKYMTAPSTESFDFYILNNSSCVGYSPDRLVFIGKYYRKEREKEND